MSPIQFSEATGHHTVQDSTLSVAITNVIKYFITCKTDQFIPNLIEQNTSPDQQFCGESRMQYGAKVGSGQLWRKAEAHLKLN